MDENKNVKTLKVLICILAFFSVIYFPTIVIAADYCWPIEISCPITATMYYSSGKYHGGTDFGASIGTPVFAIADGVVITANDRGVTGPDSSASYGNWIIIDHGNNVYSLYGHLKTGSFEVGVGTPVKQGQKIALSGNAGNVTGPHLHLELRIGGNKYKTNNVNPLDYLTRINVTVPTNQNPKGWLDGATGGAGIINVYGWSIDDDTPDQALEIHIYADGPAGEGTCIATGIIAGNDSTDVGRHRFDATFSTDLRGEHTIYAHAINTEKGHNPVLDGCPKTVYISDPDPDVGQEMASGYVREIPDGYYLIVSAGSTDKRTHYYLDIDGSACPAASGTNVSLQGLLGEPAEFDVWHLTYSDGFYTITQKGSGGTIALELYGASLKNRANVVTHTANGSSAQKWAIWRNNRDGYRIQAKCSGLSLDVADGNFASGANIQQHISNDSLAQSWLFIPYQPAQALENGKYILLSDVDNRFELDVPGDTSDVADQTKMQVWEDTAPSKYNSFEVTKLSNGYYKLIHSASRKALEVYGGGSGVMDCASLMEWNGSNAQQWAITKDGDNGGYLLRVKSSGYALDLIDAKTENGAPVRQYYYNGSKAETWKFVKAEYTISLDPNGGTTNWNEKTKNYNESAWLWRAYSPKRTGYEFLGWTEEGRNSTRIDYIQGSYYEKNADVTLYAVWKKLEPDIILPSNLEIIKEEVFSEGTFTYVKIPEGATMIESRAFADCKNMKYIEVPKSTTSISSDAFLGTNNLTILGDNGSYAEYYAQKNGFNFAIR